MTTRLIRTLAPLLLFAAADAGAAVFCVGTTEELRDALDEARSNGSDDTIQVRVGTYLLDQGLDYAPGEAKNLTLAGGYIAAASGDICLRLNLDPAATVIDGQGSVPLLRLLPGSNQGGDITVRGLTFRNGLASSTLDAVGFGGAAGWNGTLTVEANRFETLTGSGAANRAVAFSADQGRLIVRNNVFVDNVGGATNTPPISLLTSSANPAWIHHNTVTGNRTSGGLPASIGGLSLNGSGSWVFVNNIIHGNVGRDFHAMASTLLRHNAIGVMTGTPAAGSHDNLSVDPLFVSATDLRLMDASPLVDAGYATPEGGGGDRDAWGNPRVSMAAPDIGAYEVQDLLFADGFE